MAPQLFLRRQLEERRSPEIPQRIKTVQVICKPKN
jgi:hypothetical protein